MSIRGMLVVAAAAGLIFGAGLLAPPQQAEARPQYLKTFAEKYPHLKPKVEMTKCNVCHTGAGKKNRNDYGKALAEVLDAKNVKDKDTLQQAMRNVEPKPSGVSGKTWGEILKENLP